MSPRSELRLAQQMSRLPRAAAVEAAAVVEAAVVVAMAGATAGAVAAATAGAVAAAVTAGAAGTSAHRISAALITAAAMDIIRLMFRPTRRIGAAGIIIQRAIVGTPI